MISVGSFVFNVWLVAAWGLALAIWLGHESDDVIKAMKAEHGKALAEAVARHNATLAEAAADDLAWNDMVDALERIADVSDVREAREIAREAIGLPYSNWPPLPGQPRTFVAVN